MSERPVLSIEDLDVLYGGNRALSVSRLSVGAGELVEVVGANGAGKTTLVNAALGCSRGSPKVSGSIGLSGTDVSRLPTHRRVGLGLLLIPETKLIFSEMSVEENLLHVADPASAEGRRVYSLDDVFALFPNLKARRKPSEGSSPAANGWAGHRPCPPARYPGPAARRTVDRAGSAPCRIGSGDHSRTRGRRARRPARRAKRTCRPRSHNVSSYRTWPHRSRRPGEGHARKSAESRTCLGAKRR